jgi:prephenate dehydrogenase
MVEQLGLIGCGLMGGSFALALKKAGVVKRVVGFSASARTMQRALELGVIDVAATSAAQAAQGSDLVLIAVPVAATEATLRAIAPEILATTLVMDVGSTKRDVVAAARLGLGEKIGNLVPAHPIAGREVAGVENALADLYQSKQVILTPLPENTPAQLQQARDVWTALGSRVLNMTPEAHDAAFAAVSHLPHMLAFAFINAISSQPNGAELLSLAGPGFRDFTRIAASDPAVWRDIMRANRDELLAQSQQFQQQLQAFDHALQSDNTEALVHLIQTASQTRAKWQMTGPT